MWRRSEQDRLISGVLGGTAAELGVHPLVLRVTAVGTAIVLPLPVFVAYVLVSLLLESEHGTRLLGPGASRRDRLLGWTGVVSTFLLATGAAVGRASLLFAYVDPLVLAVVATATLALALRAGVVRVIGGSRPPRPAPARTVRDRPLIAFAACAGLLAACALTLAGLGPGAVLAAPAALLGAAAVLAPDGRHTRAAVGIALLAAAGSAAAIGAAATGRAAVGRSIVAPATLPGGRTGFRLGVGDLIVDLRHTRAPRGAAVTVGVDVGRALVLAPPRGVQARASSGLGPAEVRR